MNPIIQIKVGDIREAKRLLKFYAIEESRVKSELVSLESDYTRIKNNISDLKRQISIAEFDQLQIENVYERGEPEKSQIVVPSSMNQNPFDSSWTITLKAVYILREAGKLCSINEIVERLKYYEPESDLSERQIKANYSSTLSVKAKKGVAFRRMLKPGTDDYIYGLKNWFLPNGLISAGFLQEENKKAPELTEA